MIKNILIILLTTSLASCATTENINNEKEIEIEKTIGKPFSISSVNNEIFHLKTIDLAKPPVKKNKVTITFSQNEHLGDVVKGNAGCNNYFTAYSTTRSSLITGKIATTNFKCYRDQIKLEHFIFKVFSENPIVTVEGNKLYLKGMSNNLVFEKKD